MEQIKKSLSTITNYLNKNKFYCIKIALYFLILTLIPTIIYNFLKFINYIITSILTNNTVLVTSYFFLVIIFLSILIYYNKTIDTYIRKFIKYLENWRKENNDDTISE